MGKTNIGWTDESLNFFKWFCTKKSPGCQHCYMMAMAERYPANAADRPTWRDRVWRDLKHIAPGALVFVNDMSDTYHEQVPTAWIHTIHNAVAYQRPDVTFQFLTKRAERLLHLAPHLVFPPNLWVGVSVESADYAWRIDYLRQVPAAVRFVSFEPLLGPVGEVDLTGIDWAITGGESGGNRRPFDPAWAVEIQQQCERYGTAFYHKQGGDRYPGRDRELNGRIWSAWPGKRYAGYTGTMADFPDTDWGSHPALASLVEPVETQTPQGQTRLVNFHAVKEHWNPEIQQWDSNEYVYIGRPNSYYRLPGSPLANPFVIARNVKDSRKKAVALYRGYIAKQPELLDYLETLRGKTLVCWCTPAMCHGDILIEMLGESDRGSSAPARSVSRPSSGFRPHAALP